MEKQQRFIIFLVAFGCAIAMLYLLWNKQMNEFYTVLIGGAYFWFDRVRKDDDEKDKEGHGEEDT